MDGGTTTEAPFFAALADGPDGGRAVWAQAGDGVRLRIGLWPVAGARGTVLMFPGRTECVEKYGRPARELAARGYASAAIDWRGQGLADRLLPDPMVGHVGRFADYQRDVAAMLAAVAAAGLPQPLFLLAHSMGACIGLRSLLERLPVRAAAFTGPMWAIPPDRRLRPVAWALSRAARGLGQGHRYAPGSGPATYVVAAPFAGNTLTGDAEMYAWMRAQLLAEPRLALGGPSLHWVGEALAETRALRRSVPPAVPMLVAVGSRERIVDPAPIRRMVERWPAARFLPVEGAEHELLMETPPRRAAVYAAVEALFAAA